MTSPSVQALVEVLADMQRRLDQLERTTRTPQLGHAALGPGRAIAIVDEDGQTAGRIGWQPDGGIALGVEGGEPPPPPTAPTVEPRLSGLLVSWDGAMADGVAVPSDLAHAQVHISTVSGFVPDVSTRAGSIPRGGGTTAAAPLSAGATYYVRLVGATTGGVSGDASAEAAGVPTTVVEGVGPGEITETMIADDSISTPKLKASAVEADKIAANAVAAGHIQAGAVEADKLAALLVLGSRIIAGTDGAARVEINSGGLYVYDAAETLTVAIDAATGDAVFSGTVSGAEITGSRMSIGQAPGPTGVIEEDTGDVQATVTSANGQQARLLATDTQAEFSAMADPSDPAAPQAGYVAQTGRVAWVLRSDGADGATPMMQGTAEPGQAWMAVRSTGTDTSAPLIDMLANTSEAYLVCRGPSGADVRVRATGTFSTLTMTPQDSSQGAPAATAAGIFASRSSSTDAPHLALQSPYITSGQGAERRSVMFLTGTNDTARPYAAATVGASQLQVYNDQIDGVTTTGDGVVWLDSTHSVESGRHAPVTEEMQTNPPFGSTAGFVDFASGEFAPIGFRTSWSGRTRITVVTSGLNNNTGASSLSLGFRLSGPTTAAYSLKRCAFIRSTGAGTGSTQQTSASFVLQLDGTADYTLTPGWRISSGDSSTASFDLALPNLITVEPLM